MWPFTRKSAGASRRPSVVPTIDIHEAFARQRRGARLVDVRSTEEFAQGPRPRGARNVPPERIVRGDLRLSKDDEILLICHSGHRSLRAAQALAGQGYTNVSNVRGGLNAWQRAGLPLSR